MSATIISQAVAFDRLSTPKERDYDRRFLTTLALGEWRRMWREAKEKGDWATMDRLDRAYEMVTCL